jgi:glycosyltransferase involved in cell wall biosynthesis
VVASSPGAISPRWALSTEVDAIHLHWIEFLVRSSRGNRSRVLFSAARVVRLIASLVVLRARRRAVVWTVHNFAAHEPIHPRLERAATKAVAALSTGIAVHSDWAGHRMREVVGRRTARRIHVVPHGNYRGAYPSTGTRTRKELRAARGIPSDAFVFLAFGQARAYKRLPEVVAAFRASAGPTDRLLIVGQPRGDGVRDAIERSVDDDPRIITHFAFVADDAVADWYEIADAAVIAYAEVFSSGALLLALTFETPVVAPAIGSSAEIAPGESSELFRDGELSDAMIRIRTRPADRRRAARAAADGADWVRSADTLAGLYRARRGTAT